MNRRRKEKNRKGYKKSLSIRPYEQSLPNDIQKSGT